MRGQVMVDELRRFPGLTSSEVLSELKICRRHLVCFIGDDSTPAEDAKYRSAARCVNDAILLLELIEAERKESENNG